MKIHLKRIILSCGLAGLFILTACGPVFTPEPILKTLPNSTKQVDELPALTPTSPRQASTATPETAEIAVEAEEIKATSTPAEPTPVPIAGIELDRINAVGGMNLAVEAGAHWTRRNALFWSLVEPVPGQRYWPALASLEGEMLNAAQAGLELIMIVRRTPTWAQKWPGNWCGPVADEAIDEFAQFMADAVERYSVPPYNVMYWEIGNEPDVDPKHVKADELYGCWGDEADEFYGGRHYAEVLKQVYPKVKEANPEAQILVGGLLLACDPLKPTVAVSGEAVECISSKFLDGILENGGGEFFDGVSFHAYDSYWGKTGWYKNAGWNTSWDTHGPVLGAKADYLNSMLRENGYFDKYLLNTETAVLCGKTGLEDECLTEEFAQTKAGYTAQANTMAAAKGIRANIWYSIYGWRASGLMTMGQTPYPAFAAFQFNASMLKGSRFVQEVTGIEGLFGYEFMKEGKTWWIVWGVKDEQDVSLQLPSLPEAVFDLYGNVLPVSRKINVGVSPLYILFPGK